MLNGETGFDSPRCTELQHLSDFLCFCNLHLRVLSVSKGLDLVSRNCVTYYFMSHLLSKVNIG